MSAPPEELGVCKRSCCWTPYICGKNYRCECHTGDDS